MKSSEITSWYNELKSRCPNGKMTKKDMLKCYKDLSTCDMDKIEHVVSAIYKAFDTDNDGKVDFREFVIGFLLTTKGSMEEKLDYTFQLYDVDKNGYIDQSEIDIMAKYVLRMLGGNGNEFESIELLKHFISSCHCNEQGLITKEDFVRALSKNELLSQLCYPNTLSLYFTSFIALSINGNKNKQRALLIEACLLLAQDAFQVVLDSENPNAIGKMRANPTAQLKGFADHYEKCIQNTTQYERSMSEETDQDKRLKLWADLTMIARRQEIWDVCRTAARFCLLYDSEQRRSVLNITDQSSIPNVYQRDLIRLLAEIHFIAGEAEIEFIRERRIELFDTPIRPPMPTVPSAQRIQLQQESDNDWKYYCQWLQQLSIRACTHFSTGASLGQLLNESWLVCRSGEYLWNYTRHLFYSNRLRLILDPLSTIVNGLKKVGFEREILLLVNLCVALGNAYITPLPVSADDTRSISNVETTPIPQQAPTTTIKKGTKADQQTTATNVVPAGSPLTTVKTDDLKAALDICEYAINQTNEEVAKPLSVSIRDRQTLLQLWVTIKQQLQQSIKSSLSNILGDEDENTSSLNTLSRAVIAVDVLSRLDNGWHDNKDGMNLKQISL
ncbi:unnamed protein product [Rotaria sp. Silwood1]|nr:unnamed protein product [Rotaria sp. Silwood1]